MNEWISIIAVLMSPLIAVCVTMWLEKRRQKRRDKMDLFKTLMTQRGISCSYMWVNALNSIHIIFAEDSKVIKATNEYLQTLTISAPNSLDQQNYENKKTKMLEAMAQVLGYSKQIDWETIKVPYVPQWMVDEQKFNSTFRDAQLQIAKNVMQVTQSPNSVPDKIEQAEIK